MASQQQQQFQQNKQVLKDLAKGGGEKEAQPRKRSAKRGSGAGVAAQAKKRASLAGDKLAYPSEMLRAGADGEDALDSAEADALDAEATQGRGSTGEEGAQLDGEEEDPEQMAAVREQAEYVRLHKKPLQFGIEEVLCYNGHQAPVKDFVQNRNNQVNVTWTQKEVHFWSSTTGKRLGAPKILDIAKTHTQITTVAFSHRFRLYILFTADFKIFFLNELLKLVSQTEMSSLRQVNFACCHDAESKIILGNIDGVCILDFNYQGKYAPLLAAQIDQEGRHISVKLENCQSIEKMPINPNCGHQAGPHPQVKGLKVDHKNDIIVSWNANKMCFNHLSGDRAGSLIFALKDLVSSENAITDVLINLDYRYFHTGTASGEILVWKYDDRKYDDNGVHHQQYRIGRQIHTFQGHFKSVSCLMPTSSEPDLLLSAALDSTVRIWSLDKFQQLYMLHLETNGLSYIRLCQNGRTVLLAEGSRVTTNAVHLILRNHLAAEAEVEDVMAGFGSHTDYANHKVQFTISICSDNSAFIQPVRTFPMLGDDQKCTLYPPPSAQKIAAVKHSVTLNRIIVLLTNCSLCVYKAHKETALLEKILQ